MIFPNENGQEHYSEDFLLSDEVLNAYWPCLGRNLYWWKSGGETEDESELWFQYERQIRSYPAALEQHRYIKEFVSDNIIDFECAKPLERHLENSFTKQKRKKLRQSKVAEFSKI